MKTYVVLFRGINVGGRNTLPMKNLVALLMDNGFHDVQTYIQSGNVVLKSAKRPDSGIGSLIQKQFGFCPHIQVLSEREFTGAIENNPFSCANGKAVHFYFCAGTPKPDNQKIERYKACTEEYQVSGSVVYLLAPDGIGRSKLVANIEDCFGVRTTGRNLNTARKLQEMVANA